MIVYYTGVSHDVTRTANRDDLGLLGTPAGSVWRQKEMYPTWAADNGCFAELTRPGAFKPDEWLAWLKLVTPANCAFATLPDVVGDPLATWKRSAPYIDTVRQLGFPIALVMQDGLEDLPALWDQMIAVADVLFIGGSTDWKMSPETQVLAKEAIALGHHVHMGRVNSYKRLSYASRIGCQSADGTYLKFGSPEKRTEHAHMLLGWLDRLNAQGAQP